MTDFIPPAFTPDDLNKSNAPKQRWPWIRALLPRPLQPYVRGLRKRIEIRRTKSTLVEPFRTIYPYTQVAVVRQENLLRLAGIIEQEKIPGDLVECGVLDGGTAALVGWATRGSNRRIHLFDAWQGLPESTAEDGQDARQWTGQIVGSPRRVSHILQKMGVEPQRVVIHKGWFHETFPKADIPQVALAHIDCDFYEPTKLCLEKWYPVLAPGGFFQFDDYDSFQGCRTAVDAFVAEHPELKLESYGPYVAKARFIRKPLN